MAQHAGFAAAVTIREQTLAIALEAAYANGSFPTKLVKEDLPFGGPKLDANLFLGPPEVQCEGATGLLVLTLGVWGRLTVTEGANPAALVDVVGEIEISLDATFSPGESVQLEAEGNAIVVRRWTAVVTSPGTPSGIAAYVVGEDFRERIQSVLRGAVFIKQITLPSIDVSFLGPIGTQARTVKGKVRNGALLLGFNIDNDTTTIIGDPEALQDFAGGYAIAGVINADATVVLLDALNTRMVSAVEDEGASLDRFRVTPKSGYFYVDGAASNSDGTVNFTFHLVPQMFHTRPGAFFPSDPTSRRVKPQTWAALEFRIEGVETDVDRSFWTIVKEVVFGFLTAGLAVLYAEEVISATAGSFSSQLQSAKPGSATARVRHTIAPPGGVGVRIGVEQFDISPTGAILGPKVLPSDYAHDRVRYQVRLPSGAHESDPALWVHWRLEDRTNGFLLVNDDRPARGRLRLEFTPSTSLGASDFVVVARVYRLLDVQATEVSTQSLNLHLRGALPLAAYVRWRSQVRNPQIKLDPVRDTWSYQGEAQVRRWSEWHRTDAPCHAVNATHRYRFELETADRLPFPLRLLESHRKGLCPYCFYGGPAGTNPEL
jgi:hypothetical protein